MVAPAIAGGLISAGGSLLGGALGSFDANRQIKYQKQFAKKGIQWRVKDAKAAGLHPLYALGAQTPQYSPVQSSLGESLAQAGQNIGAAVAGQMSPTQKKLLDLSMAQAQASLDKTYAETAYIQSERLKTIMGQFQWLPEENLGEKGGGSTVFGGQAVPVSQGVPSNYVTPKAPDLPSESSTAGVMAGTPPGLREYRFTDGFQMLLPGGVSGDASEALESLSESPMMMLGVINMNRRHYGPGWFRKFLETTVGRDFVKFYDWTQRNRGKFDGSAIPQDPRLWRK